ncbi:MAG: VOC family protein [Pseudomonadota bacterium]
MQDLFEPSSDGAQALVGALHTVTCLTTPESDLGATLEQGLALSASPFAGNLREAAAYLGLPGAQGLTLTGYNRSDAGRNVQVRVITSAQAGAAVRPEPRGQFPGGLSLGFPMHEMPSWVARMKDAGIEAAVGIKEMTFTSPAGDDYTSAEVHFPAAENIFLLGVRRPETFRPVGPMSNEEPIGAAAYSARCVTDADAVIDFYRDTFGYEIRRDASFEVTGPSGLRLAPGTQERFVQAFAPGTASGYLVFLDHGDQRELSPAPTAGPPARGLVLWSFPTARLDAMYERITALNLTLRQPPGAHGSPLLPAGRSLIFEDPDGFPIELFEAPDLMPATQSTGAQP